MALASTIPPGVGDRSLRALRARLAWRLLTWSGLGLLTLHWLVVTGFLALFAFPVDLSFWGRFGNGVTVPESYFWPVLLYVFAFPLAMPMTAWVWVRVARAALGPGRPGWRRWIPAAAVSLFGLQTASWVPFVLTLSRD